MLDKTALRDAMLALEQNQLQVVKKNYLEFLQQARVDDSDGFDEDELSHALENSDMAELFDQPIHDHQDKILLLQQIDFSEKTQVEPGAVVKFNDRYFVISVATSRFEFDGKSFIGISSAAPIYAQIQDLEAGDFFSFNGKDTEIQAVY
ncbi:MAG: hypothetical protein R3E95_10735 [Thiolinea sp.]